MPLSVKTKEHFRRRMALAGPKWGALMGGAVALAGVIMFTTSALHFVTVTDTHGGSTRILTVNQTEAAVLAQAGVAPLGENDRIVTSETPDGELMQVLRAYTVPVTADGQTQEIITTGATTRDLLTQAGLTYTEEDYQLACITFYKALTSLGFKISLPDKDFLPGISEAKQLLQCIDQSRKVVIIVTENFLENGWNSYAVQMVVTHAFHNQREQSIIVIIKDDISLERLPRDLKYIWWSIVSIRWPNGDETMDKFCEEICAALRPDP